MNSILKFVLYPIAFTNYISKIINFFTFSLLLTLFKFTNINISIFIEELSMPLSFILFPFSFITISVIPEIFSKSISISIFKLTNINISFYGLFSKSIIIVLFELTLVVISIFKNQSPKTFSLII